MDTNNCHADKLVHIRLIPILINCPSVSMEMHLKQFAGFFTTRKSTSSRNGHYLSTTLPCYLDECWQ